MTGYDELSKRVLSRLNGTIDERVYTPPKAEQITTEMLVDWLTFQDYPRKLRNAEGNVLVYQRSGGAMLEKYERRVAEIKVELAFIDRLLAGGVIDAETHARLTTIPDWRVPVDGHARYALERKLARWHPMPLLGTYKHPRTGQVTSVYYVLRDDGSERYLLPEDGLWFEYAPDELFTRFK